MTELLKQVGHLSPDELADWALQEATSDHDDRPWRCEHRATSYCTDCVDNLEAHYESAVASWNISMVERDRAIEELRQLKLDAITLPHPRREICPLWDDDVRCRCTMGRGYGR